MDVPSSMSVPNLKRIALFVQKLLEGPKFRPTADPLPGGSGRPNFNQLEIVTTDTYKLSLVRIDACNFVYTKKMFRETQTLRAAYAGE